MLSAKGDGSTSVTTKVTVFEELLSEARFRVPRYQRIYDWGTEEIHTLLHDLKDALDEKRGNYFLGTVMLMRDPSGSDSLFEINDGQQRITTVSLIFASLRPYFKVVLEKKLALINCRLFDMSLSEYSRTSEEDMNKKSLRLELCEGDSVGYEQIVRGQKLGRGGNLTNAVKVIEEFLNNMTINELEDFYDFLIERVEVACVFFDKKINPNSIFETLNDRGKPLEEFDKVRNYFYWQFTDPSEKPREKVLHKGIESIRITLDLERQKKASEYARCFLQCEYGLIRKNTFYADMKKSFKGEGEGLKNTVFNLVERMAQPENMSLYQFISSTTHDPGAIEKFNSQTRRRKYEYRSLDVFLNELRPYTVTWPLFYALLYRWWICMFKKDFSGAKKEAVEAWHGLNTLSSFVTRTSFIVNSFKPSNYEEQFATLANEIYKDKKSTDIDASRLRGSKEKGEPAWLALEDKLFSQKIEGMTIYNNTKAKKFLIGIEELHRKAPVAIRDKECTLEHILPRNSRFWDSWTGFRSDPHEYWVYRIGNLVLLSHEDNNSGDEFNSSFKKKKETYKTSEIKTTRPIAKIEKWNPDEIKNREAILAQQSKRAWPLD